MLAGLYSYGQAAGLTHAYAAAFASCVFLIHRAPLATERHPGQQQRHHQHLRSGRQSGRKKGAENSNMYSEY
jgi:hypothetical protein